MIRRMAAVAPALLLLCGTPVAGQARRAAAARCPVDAFRGDIRGAVRGYIDVTGIPGMSVAVVVNDQVILADGIGYANRRLRTPATADTPYNIASVTKLFTAMLVMQLEEEGRLGLDAPIARYLPDSVHVPVDPSGTPITARHLLTHTAGLPPNPPNRRNLHVDGPVDPGVWDAFDVPDLYTALATTTLRSRPGTTMVYSNFGYALLGHLAELASGQRYETLLKNRILTPLGMRSSGITLSEEQSRRLASFYWDEDEARTEQRVHARFGDVAGFIGVTSTVRDLAQFLMAYLGTTPAGRSVISPSVATRMVEPQVQLDPENRTHRVDMAVGWFREVAIAADSAGPLLWHLGEIDGHASAVFLQPHQRIGVVLLQNLGGAAGAVATEQVGRWLVGRTQAAVSSCRR